MEPAIRPLSVIHEDDRLVVVAKPSGRVVAGPDPVPLGSAGPAEPSLQDQVAAHVGASVFVVHRLDRGTSGVVVFARDAAEHRRLSLLFEARAVEKTYLAVALGHLDADAGEIAAPLRAFGSGRVGVDRRGKPATTEYERREHLARADLLELRPRTGRRHQLRVHLYSIGHPILGDDRYGAERPIGGVARLMLHALELSLADATGAPVTLRAEPPGDFMAILDAERSAEPSG